MANRISVLLPITEASESALRATLESLAAQDYPHFEVRAVVASKALPHLDSVLKELRDNPRIHCLGMAEPSGLTSALNNGLRDADGDFVGVLRPGDRLERSALGVMNHFLSLGSSDVDFVYTDESIWSDAAQRSVALYKPDWSPERLRSQHYTGQFAVARRSIVAEAGGFRERAAGADWYDLALRVTERGRRVVHVPQTLCSSIAVRDDEEAGQRAIQDHCDRVGIAATVSPVANSSYRLHRAIDGHPLVSIVIPTGGASRRVWGTERVLVVEAVRSVLQSSTYQNIEVVIVADTTTPPGVIASLVDLLGQRLTVIYFDGPFNFSKKCNLGAAASRGEYLVLLNDDVEIISPDWIETMLGIAQGPDVGLVGAKLLFSDGTLQHAGQFNGDSRPQHIFFHYPADLPGPGCMLQVDRECSGVTAACAMIRTSRWDEVGGLTQMLPNNFNDVDLSLKLRHRGYRNVWTPHAQLFHFESLTRDGAVSAEEYRFIQTRWDEQLRVDPYGNPNLDPTRSDWVPRSS